MKIRLKAPEGLTSTGIYGKNGVEMAVGEELVLDEEPKGWAGRYDIIQGGEADGKAAIVNPATTSYAVKEKGAGWFVITKDGEEVTKSIRKDGLEGFDEMSDEDKAIFAELHKKEA